MGDRPGRGRAPGRAGGLRTARAAARPQRARALGGVAGRGELAGPLR